MMRNRLLLFLISLFCVIVPTFAQVSVPISNLLEIEIINAGYGGLYRSDEWFPIQVRITNYGVDFSGRVVVRPQTTAGLQDTYAVPISELSAPLSPDNPTIAQTTLYAIGQNRDLNLHVELVNQTGATVASAQTPVRNIPTADRMYIVISSRTLNMMSAVTRNASALQANWTLNNIPNQAGALSAVNALVLDDVNTSALTQAQSDALQTWVLNGGHLIIAGTSDISGLADGLSPFIPDGMVTERGTSSLLRFTKRGDVPVGLSMIATGTVAPTARLLAETDQERPLIVRHEVGHGTVDYLTFSPSLAPFTIWRGTNDVLFTLLASTQPVPPWAYGFYDWGSAHSALQIMPGLTLLPSVWSLLAFLTAYVVVIGPINYLILTWINRRDYAWYTIPLSIMLFSFLAYSLGFELRGEVVTMNRLNVVQAWTNSDQAQVNQLIGLLSPQRGTYNLSPQDGNLLRPLGEYSSVLTVDRQSTVEILQSPNFEAHQFTVDASFMIGFSSEGTIPRPQINGAVTVTVDPDGNKSLRGYIQNDLPFTLSYPTLITAGITHPLGETLSNGLIDLSITSPTPPLMESVTASPQEHLYNTSLVTHNAVVRSRQAAYVFSNEQDFNLWDSSNDRVESQRNAQRDYLIQTLLHDQYATTGRGNRVFLIGWSDQAILDASVNVNSQQIRESNTTLYIIELEAEYPTQESRTITQDQFTWITMERGTGSFTAPVLLEPAFDDPLAFRFTPQPTAILDHVEQLTIIVDRASLTNRRVMLEIWNWKNKEWDFIEAIDDEWIVIDDPAPYLGALNAVELRTIPRIVSVELAEQGTPTLNRMGVMQTGS